MWKGEPECFLKKCTQLNSIQVLYDKTGNDPLLLERVGFAFGLLEAIARVGLSFGLRGILLFYRI